MFCLPLCFSIAQHIEHNETLNPQVSQIIEYSSLASVYKKDSGISSPASPIVISQGHSYLVQPLKISPSTKELKPDHQKLNQQVILPIGMGLVTETTTVFSNRNSNSSSLLSPRTNTSWLNLNVNALVRGEEDGRDAVNFRTWLIPYSTLIKVFSPKIEGIEKSLVQWNLPWIVTKVDQSKLIQDPDLGLSFSIQQIEEIFNVRAEFNINEYGIVFSKPRTTSNNQTLAEKPLALEGLTAIHPSTSFFTALQHQTSFRDNSQIRSDSGLALTGELQLLGTLFNGAWSLDLEHPIQNTNNQWQLSRARYSNINAFNDYFIGSQSVPWVQTNRTNNDYWGLTWINRRGFSPDPKQSSQRSLDLTARLQSNIQSRAIAGEAEPGTLVQLTYGRFQEVIDEILVDSSGIYRFEDLTFGRRSRGNYELRLYPNGRLTETPLIREPTFLFIPGQIPEGTTVTLLSAGFDRERSVEKLFGDFTNPRGGLIQRWGLKDNLTIGFNGFYDRKLYGAGEVFWQPQNLPLEIATTISIPNEEQEFLLNGKIAYRPSSSLSATFFSDNFERRGFVNLNFFRGFQSRINYSSRRGWSITQNLLRYFSLKASQNQDGEWNISPVISAPFFYLGPVKNSWRMNLDENSILEGKISSEWKNWQVDLEKNDVAFSGELDFNFTPSLLFRKEGHSLGFSYQNSLISNQNNDLYILGWRYRSPRKKYQFDPLFDATLQYGFGSQGSGILASLNTTIIPGLKITGSYETIGLTSNANTFRLELESNLNFFNTVRPTSSRNINNLANKGSLLIQPFYDLNADGKKNNNEDFFVENIEYLVQIDYKNLAFYQPTINKDGVSIPLSTGQYRLDLEESGFPLDWRPQESSYAVDIRPSSHTSLQIPFHLFYTVFGELHDQDGLPLSQVNITAIELDSGSKFSVQTNNSGVFYLENLKQGTYSFSIDNQSIQLPLFHINNESPTFQELILILESIQG